MKFGTEAFAMHCVEMAGANPNGFRNPGRRGTSLVERAMIAAGLATPQELASPPSKRGKRKREARARHREIVRKQQAAGLELRANRKGMG